VLENVCDPTVDVSVTCWPASSCNTKLPLEIPVAVTVIVSPPTIGTHVTPTVTLAVAVPVLLLPNVHVSPDGCVKTVTEYAPPLLTAVENADVPFALTIRLFPRLFCSTTLAPDESPLTLTLIVNPHVTATVTFAVAVPMLLLPNVHVSPDGCVNTVTEYAPPLLTAVENADVPFALTVRLFPRLFCSTTLAPVARPLTLALIVKVAGGGVVPVVVPPPQAVKDTSAPRVSASRNNFIAISVAKVRCPGGNPHRTTRVKRTKRKLLLFQKRHPKYITIPTTWHSMKAFARSDSAPLPSEYLRQMDCRNTSRSSRPA
jgi:hypothetical protein